MSHGANAGSRHRATRPTRRNGSEQEEERHRREEEEREREPADAAPDDRSKALPEERLERRLGGHAVELPVLGDPEDASVRGRWRERPEDVELAQEPGGHDEEEPDPACDDRREPEPGQARPAPQVRCGDDRERDAEQDPVVA